MNTTERSRQITQEISRLAKDFNFSFPPHWLRECGYTQRQIELAVARGALCWNRDGTLSALAE